MANPKTLVYAFSCDPESAGDFRLTLIEPRPSRGPTGEKRYESRLKRIGISPEGLKLQGIRGKIFSNAEELCRWIKKNYKLLRNSAPKPLMRRAPAAVVPSQRALQPIARPGMIAQQYAPMHQVCLRALGCAPSLARTRASPHTHARTHTRAHTARTSSSFSSTRRWGRCRRGTTAAACRSTGRRKACRRVLRPPQRGAG